mmetsp:Transcript_22333/g.84727  ORF Transcript_22333/g.84727 Transcript_22333/m.84727 type:complete len:243 (+) Transcript_22333:995-1723(+)
MARPSRDRGSCLAGHGGTWGARRRALQGGGRPPGREWLHGPQRVRPPGSVALTVARAVEAEQPRVCGRAPPAAAPDFRGRPDAAVEARHARVRDRDGCGATPAHARLRQRSVTRRRGGGHGASRGWRALGPRRGSGARPFRQGDRAVLHKRGAAPGTGTQSARASGHHRRRRAPSSRRQLHGAASRPRGEAGSAEAAGLGDGAHRHRPAGAARRGLGGCDARPFSRGITRIAGSSCHFLVGR